MTEDSMTSLNGILFGELRRLSDTSLAEDPERMEREIRRAHAITDVAREVISGKNAILKAVKLADELGIGGVIPVVTGEPSHAGLIPQLLPGKAKGDV